MVLSYNYYSNCGVNKFHLSFLFVTLFAQMTKRFINDPLDLTPPRTSPMEKGGANISSEQTSAYSRGTLSTILARPGPFTSETGGELTESRITCMQCNHA